MSDQVCSLDGVPVAQSRSGRWVHTDIIPANVEAHDTQPVPAEEYEARAGDLTLVRRDAAVAYARDLRERMARPEMAGVAWNEISVHCVTLLVALEACEARYTDAHATAEHT